MVLPNRSFYRYLTDRVGNFSELEPYLFLWKLLGNEVDAGVLEIVVQHDGTGDVPAVGKMTDGMADRDTSQSNMQQDTQQDLGSY